MCGLVAIRKADELVATPNEGSKTSGSHRRSGFLHSMLAGTLARRDARERAYMDVFTAIPASMLCRNPLTTASLTDGDRLSAKDQRPEPEKPRETDHIGDHDQDHPARNRRVDSEAPQQQRYSETGGCAADQIDRQREGDDETDRPRAEPQAR